MSLIVNSTTIPETDGAIKVGSTNVQKVVVNSSTVWEVPQGYTVSWSDALSTVGSYIGSTSPATVGRYSNKQIRYTKPNGTVAIANPYAEGEIIVKKGTPIYFDMYAVSSSASDIPSIIQLFGSTGRKPLTSASGVTSGLKGSLITAQYTLIGNGVLSKLSESNRHNGYFWDIELNYNYNK